MKIRNKILIVSALTMMSTAGKGLAQGFGGSFDTGPGVESTPAQPTPAAPDAGGDFGGSFGGDFGGGVAQPAPTATPTPAPSVGGDDFSGGSFDQVQPGPGTPAPEPPDNPVNPPAPTDQTGPQIDPQVLAFESRDFGIPPSNQLRNGQMHAATPTAIPGGYVVSTEGLASAMNSGHQIVLIDVLGSDYSLPSAQIAPGMAQPGSYQDRVQQQVGQWLQQLTNGNPDVPIVIFCSDPQCWLSYNAALRAINAGYQQVYWYRGGLQAWQMAGLPLQPASF